MPPAFLGATTAAKPVAAAAATSACKLFSFSTPLDGEFYLTLEFAARPAPAFFSATAAVSISALLDYLLLFLYRPKQLKLKLFLLL